MPLARPSFACIGLASAAFGGTVAGCAGPRSSVPPAPRFRDLAREAGIDFRHENGASPQKHLVETMGAGAAVLDYDNDGWPDILLVNGRSLTGSGAGNRSGLRLYRNLGAAGGLRFQEVTREAGLNATVYGMGCAAGDFDNDGWTDIYVSSVLDPGRLFRNRAGKFEDATARAGVGNEGRWGTGCAWLDYDRDGLLDLYVAGYVRYRSLADEIPCIVRQGQRSYCIPSPYQGSSGILYRNLGDGRFADVTREASLADPAQKALGVVAADLDGNGWPDLLVANDTVPNRLFLNRPSPSGKSRFEESALLAGLAFGPAGQARAGMGIDLADWRNDGSLMVAVTNFASESIGCYTEARPGALLFTDQSAAFGVGEASAPFLGFGIRFFDMDNDGFEDLCAVNGHVRDDIEQLEPGQTYAQPALLFRNLNGKRFEEVSAATGAPVRRAAVRRGLAAGDFDRDGRIDLLVTQNGGPAELWHNETAASGHWIGIRLRGTRSNREGLGARVTTRQGGVRRTRLLRSGGSYLSDSEHLVHFGLGSATRVEAISIQWPSGRLQEYPAAAADQVLTLEEAPP